MKITVGVITLNEESNLGRCLESVSGIADEILVVDSGSTDRTQAIAEKHGARWHMIPWEGYVQQKNHVLRLASHPWVLSLDADEALSAELRQEILEIKTAGSISQETSGFSMPRCVWYEDRWIRHGDWYPDRLTRLFRREHAEFVGGRVHERLSLEGNVHRLRHDLLHYSFVSAEDHLARCQRYARLWAEDRRDQCRRCGPFAPELHAAFRWFRAYLLRGGFLDGRVGLKIANLSAYEVFLKYSLLRKLNRS